MADVSQTVTYAGLVSSTLRTVRTGIADNIFQLHPFINAFQATGRVQMQAGGRNHEVTLEREVNPAAGWINWVTGTASIEKHDPFTMNTFDWKIIVAPVWALHWEANQNAGRAKLFDLMTAKKNNVKKTIAKLLEAAVAGAQSGDGPYGMQDLVATAPTTGTVGIINRANETWYQNGYYNCSGRAFSIYGRTDMRRAWLALEDEGTSMKDVVIFTDSDTFALYDDETLEMKQIVNKKLGDIAFETLVYHGQPMLHSPQAQAGAMRFIDMNEVYLVVNSLVSLELGIWKHSQTSLDLVAHMPYVCNMVTKNARRTYVTFNMAA